MLNVEKKIDFFDIFLLVAFLCGIAMATLYNKVNANKDAKLMFTNNVWRVMVIVLWCIFAFFTFSRIFQSEYPLFSKVGEWEALSIVWIQLSIIVQDLYNYYNHKKTV